ncbi:MAG: CRTAC1 family protein [Planctomycetota bacterium]|nr:CRTAC1 family protein [Planctomycetota bacterium]
MNMKAKFTYCLLLLTTLSLVLTGCQPDDPLDQLTDIANLDSDGNSSNNPVDTGLPDLSTDENLGSRDVGQGVILQDITNQTGVDFTYRNGRDAGNNSILESLGGGVGILDYDMNGTLDFFLPGGGKYEQQKIVGLSGALYRNDGKAQFDEVTDSSFTNDASLYTHGCQVADFDNDGFPDFLLTGWNSLKFFHNQGDGTFLEIHAPAGLDNQRWSSSAAWGDFNGDGFLDVYVCNYVNWSFENNPFCQGPNPGQQEICPPKQFQPLPDIIYYSNGDGTFYNATQEAGLTDKGKGLGVMACDFDMDGDLDIYVANDTVANFLYVNEGNGVFKERGTLFSVAFDGLGNSNGSMGIDVGDYNLDGKPDIWVANYEQEAFALYRNDGKSMFTFVSDRTGVTSLGGLFVGFGTVFYDFDYDGDEDLLVTNGHVINYPRSGRLLQMPLLLMNEMNAQSQYRKFIRRRFDDHGYMNTGHSGRGLALGDLDGDGDADFIFSNNVEPSAVIENQTKQTGQNIRVKLVGTAGNRDAVGSILTLHTSIGNLIRLTRGGASYLSQSDNHLYWSLPADATVDHLHIQWPNGTEQIIQDVPTSQPLMVVQPAAN